MQLGFSHRLIITSDILKRERESLGTIGHYRTNTDHRAAGQQSLTQSPAASATGATSSVNQARGDRYEVDRNTNSVSFHWGRHVVGPPMVGATLGIAIGLAGPDVLKYGNEGCKTGGRCWLPELTHGASPLSGNKYFRVAGHVFEYLTK